MIIAFKIVLFAILCIGNGFVYRFYYEARGKESSLRSTITWLYPMLCFFCFITWIVSSRNAALRLFFLMSFSVIFTFSSIYAALGANLLLSSVENRLQNTRNVINYSKRLLLMALSAMAIATAMSVTKSALYLSGASQYTFGNELDHIIKTNVRSKVADNAAQRHDIATFLKDVTRIQQDSIPVKSKHFFSFIIGGYELEIDNNLDFELEYSYFYGGKDSRPMHKIFYDKKNKDQEAFIVFDAVKIGRFSYIRKDELVEAVKFQHEQFDKIEQHLQEKPAELVHFAFSSLVDFFGIKDYEIIPSNSNTETIDVILKWLFWILTTFVFFEFVRTWQKQGS